MLTAHDLNALLPYALPEELDWVSQYAARLNPDSLVVMIGAGPGVFALAVMEGAKEIPIDFFIIDHDTVRWTDAHLSRAGVNLDRVFYIIADSARIGEEWEPNSVDFLIVDGDHSFDGVSRDIHAWEKAIRPGGVVFFHDYLEREGGFNGTGPWVKSDVCKAVHIMLKDGWEEIEQVGISIVFRKCPK